MSTFESFSPEVIKESFPLLIHFCRKVGSACYFKKNKSNVEHLLVLGEREIDAKPGPA